ncbi:MAG: outer membrane protein assembly factor BamD [Acidobacteria bacterium]|nr:outer membrane protein assembly factor BamD [Acidobacteriota bacterium]
MRRNLLFLSLLLLTAMVLGRPEAFGASKEMQQLQRDVAQLHEEIRDLQRAQNERLTALEVLLKQTLDTANRAVTNVAVLESGIRDRLREQEKSVTGPVASVGAKIDQMSHEFLALRESIADLTARMGKLQQQIVDLNNVVRSMQAPPPPPPGAAPSGALNVPPAETLYQNALRDRSGGKTELALEQFADYVKHYGDTDLAPNAQYYIGEIYYSDGELEEAIKNFDLLLERYPDNEKTDDALYMKGVTLVKQRKLTQGAQEFRELLRRFPRSEHAPKAQAQLKAFGLSAPAPARKAASRR